MTLYPFNMDRALAGEPVVTESGIKAYDFSLINGIGKYTIKCRLEGMFLTGYTEDGKFYDNKSDIKDLYMLTPDPIDTPILIDFDINKYKSGEYNLIYRNRQKPISIHFTPFAKFSKVITVNETGKVIQHLEEGKQSFCQKGYDLFLIKKNIKKEEQNVKEDSKTIRIEICIV